MVAVNSLNQNIQIFLNEFFKGPNYTVYQLAGDASARKYYRIVQDQTSYVLMVWEPFDPERYPFLDVLNHFKLAGVSVPQVLSVNGKVGVMLLEDLGDLTLERKFSEASSFSHSWPFYQKAIDQIVKIHRNATALDRPTICKTTQFDTAKFLWEMNYAKEHLLDGLLKFKFDDANKAALDKIFFHFCSGAC